MAEIEITLPENYTLNEKTLTDHLCQTCLNKISGSLKYWKYVDETKEPIPLCLVDFDTLEIYSLQDCYQGYFVRDYYIELEYKENHVETKIFYLPER